ncbi:MAG TPA: lipoyl domain-containing protein [Conexibacter sp.]|nr:lipoyl domain-containing protein [Conexibacter sp.]
MRSEIRMANLGYDMETGRVEKWLKQVGDAVQRGEPIVEVETDKATIEMEATQSGTLAEIVAAEGQDVAVGDVIAYLDADD